MGISLLNAVGRGTPEDQALVKVVGNFIDDVQGRLIAARTEAGVTQKELARRMKTTQSAISEFELGVDFRLSTLVRYVSALGLPLTFTVGVDTSVIEIR